jgi:hypothetical protein
VVTVLFAGCGRSAVPEVTIEPPGVRPPVGCAPAAAACVARAPFEAQLVTWTLEAPLVFQGTVQRINASTEATQPSTATRPLFVASVDQRLWGPEVTAEVTVDPSGAAMPAPGTTAVFFVRPFVYGVGVVTVEVARAALGTFGNILNDVPAIRRVAAERELYDALLAAQRVVVAQVASVAGQPAGSIGSEHDPVWTESTVDIQCALRGTASPSAAVRFAASTDIGWAQSPKLSAGQRGVLLLHGANSDPYLSGTYGRGDAFTGEVVARPTDVLAAAELQHVVDLLACPPTLP